MGVKREEGRDENGRKRKGRRKGKAKSVDASEGKREKWVVGK